MDTHHEQKTMVQVITASLGFILVAFLTAITGYTLSNSALPARNDLILIGIYSLLVWPYYLSRQALLERDIDSLEEKYDSYTKSIGIQVPSIMFILFALIAFFVLSLFYSFPIKYLFGQRQDIVISLALGLLPFFVLDIYHVNDLRVKNSDKAFRFTERVLFPALATGIVPLAFGWSLFGQSISLLGTLIGAFYVILLVTIPDRLHIHPFYTVVAIFVLVTIAFIFIRIEVLRVIMYGTLITLAMAVSETMKRVHLVSIKDRNFPEAEGPDYYLAGANWSSIVFPLLLCLVPLLIYDLPAWPLLIFIALQCLSWLFISLDVKASRSASILGLLFGYGLPITLILTQVFNLPVTLKKDGGISPFQIIALPTILVSLGIFLFGTLNLSKELGEYIYRMTKHETYLKKNNNYFLFYIVLIILLIMVLIVGSISAIEVVRIKAYEIIVFATILMLIVGGSFFATHIKGRQGELSQSGTSSSKDESDKPGRSKFQLVWITSRPITSTVAGLSSFVILVRGDNYPIWVDVVLSLPIILVTMVGFILNDIYDYEKDSRAGLNRPIAQGMLDRRLAGSSAFYLSIVALVIVTLFGNVLSFAVLLATLIGVLIYSPLSRIFPIAKGFAATALSLAPTIYAIFLTKAPLPSFVPVAISIFMIGREMLLDIKDLKKDLLSGVKTIVAYLGLRTSRVVAWLMMFIGVIYLLISMWDLSKMLGISFALLGLLSLVLSLLIELHQEAEHGGLTKLTMIFCLLAIPFAL